MPWKPLRSVQTASIGIVYAASQIVTLLAADQSGAAAVVLAPSSPTRQIASLGEQIGPSTCELAEFGHRGVLLVLG